MPTEKLTLQQVEQYNRDGYIIIKNFCSPAEIDKLYHTALDDNAMRNNALDLNDQSGKKQSSLYGLRPGMTFLVI